MSLTRTLSRSAAGLLLLALAALHTGCGGAAPTDELEIASRGLYAAAISRTGDLAVAGSVHHGGSLWNTRSRQRLFNWNHAEGQYTNIVAAAFSGNGRFAATADERTIALWNTTTGENIAFWTAPGDILDIEVTDNADFAILALADHTAVVFDIKRGGVLRTFVHNGRVRAVAIAEQARLLVTGSDDFQARLWKISTGRLLHTWPHDNQVNVVAVSPDGRFAFSASQADRAVIWNADSGEPVSELPINKYPYTAGSSYTAARFSDDGSRLLTGASNRYVQAWDSATGTERGRWQGNKRGAWKPTNPTVMAITAGTGEAPVAIGSNGLVWYF